MYHGVIVLAVVLVLMTLLLATCVGIVLYMNRSSKPTISKSNNDNVKKKQPIPDIENLDMVALFGKKAWFIKKLTTEYLKLNLIVQDILTNKNYI